MFPIFAKQDTSHSFRWIEPPLGQDRTCLHGINLSPKPSSKIAAFDLDGCLIQSSFGRKTKGLPPSPPYAWWRPVVPKRLQELHEEGYVHIEETLTRRLTSLESYSIVIVTNQALRGASAIPEWKKKVPVFAASVSALLRPLMKWNLTSEQLPEVPFHIFAATARDGYRKPIPGIWYEIQRIFAEDNVIIGRLSFCSLFDHL